MDPVIRDEPGAHRFVAEMDGREAGVIVYVRARGRIAFMHTEVGEDFAGQGIGRRLAAFALDQARAEGLEVMPFCPFVRGYIAKHPEYAELVPEPERPRFNL